MNSNQMEKCESLYFMDGNVILLAQRTGRPALLFRVHRSVLSSQSPIFSDMFDVCGPSGMKHSDGSDHYHDGVPLVHMPDDAHHLESVLKILYFQSSLPWKPRSPDYPELVTPILELSKKYEINRITEQILRHIESDWPQTLKDWDKLESDIDSVARDPDALCKRNIDDHFPEPASAIKLAHLLDIPNILPAAFYHLSRLSILDDWYKTHTLQNQNRTKRTARWQLLSARDFRCLLLGKAELTETLRGSMKTGEFFHKASSYGYDSDEHDCIIGVTLWKDIRDACIQSADPLARLQISIELEVSKVQCVTCAKALKAKILLVRTSIWENLGNLFHLKDE